MTCPPTDCSLCTRLAAFRQKNRVLYPEKFNAPVPPFGPVDVPFLITGLAPGLKGANFTGRPFTGDYAGILLYDTLVKYGFATGLYKAHVNDGLQLSGCRISNAVKCVPPENKPTTGEIKTCSAYLAADIEEMPGLKLILALGKIAHDAVLRVYSRKLSQHKFIHGAVHEVARGIYLVDSYHCSRYNTQTGRLTTAMFEEVIGSCRNHLARLASA